MFMSCQSNTQPQQCTGCVDAKAKNGWCDHCKVGYKPDGTTTKCQSCHTGITGQTVWCDGCKKGYINGKATKCQGCVAQAKGGPKCAT
jgi:hypothetical protein